MCGEIRLMVTELAAQAKATFPRAHGKNAKKSPGKLPGLNGCRTRNGTCSQLLRAKRLQKVQQLPEIFHKFHAVNLVCLIPVIARTGFNQQWHIQLHGILHQLHQRCLMPG